MRAALVLLLLAACDGGAAVVPLGGGPAFGGRGALGAAGAGGGGIKLVCGDGYVSSPEQCDDGNTTNGDGCSSTCKVELGFTCTGAPSTCTGGGLDAIPSSIMISGATFTPWVDWRGRLCSSTAADGSAGCIDALGRKWTVQSNSGTAITYAQAAGTSNSADKIVNFGTSSADILRGATGTTNTGDIATETDCFEWYAKTASDLTSNRIPFSKGDRTNDAQEWWFAESTTNTELVLGNTGAETVTAGTTMAASTLQLCTMCVDRSSTTGTNLACNGEIQMVPANQTARAATLAIATPMAIGGLENAGVPAFGWGGGVGLMRMWRVTGSTHPAQADVIALNQLHMRYVPAATHVHGAFGDSLTQGFGGNPTPDRRWPELLVESGSSFKTINNHGVSGETCQQIHDDQWAAQKGNGYAIDFFMCGMNDIIHSSDSAATIEARIATLVTEAHALTPRPKVVVMTITPCGAFGVTCRTSVITAINTWIMAGSSGADFAVDTNTPLNDGSGNLNAPDDNGDGLHLTLTGHQAIATAVAAVVTP